MIPFFGVARQYANLRKEILDKTDEVLLTGKVLDGEYTSAFEAAIAARCDRKHAISVNSGTMGLLFALQTREEELNKGILIPAVSFIATLNTALLTSDATMFCDTDNAGLMDLQALDDPINSNFDTIMYVNLFGNTLDYDKFRLMSEFFCADKKPFVIEDAAQSFGASYKGIPSGKMGDVSVLSFDPTKNLNNYGSGGMVLTDDDYIASCLRNYKDNGKESGQEMVGTNNKMSEVDCAQMLIKLRYFDAWQKRRTQIAEYYMDHIGSYVDLLPITEGCVHAWSKFAFRVQNNRAGLRNFLHTNDIETRIHYPQTMYDEVVGRLTVDAGNSIEEAQRFVRETMSLPIYPELTDSEVEHIAQSVRKFYLSYL